VSAEKKEGRENKLAELQEDTEQRMHSVADALPNPEGVHERASQLSERAQEHRRRAQRADDEPE